MNITPFFLAATLALAPTLACASGHTIVKLTPSNINGQTVAFSVSRESSPNGQHFKVAVDTKGQPVKFLGAYMNLFEDGGVPVAQTGVPEGHDGSKTLYGFFVNKKFFRTSGFYIPLFNTQENKQYTYWFELKDFAPAPARPVVKTQVNPNRRERFTIIQNGKPYAMFELPVGLAKISTTSKSMTVNDQTKTMVLKGASVFSVSQGDAPALSIPLTNGVVKVEQVTTR